MKVRYIGKERENFIFKNNIMDLTPGKVYDVIDVDEEYEFYRIIDDSGEDYLYPPFFFEIVEP